MWKTLRSLLCSPWMGILMEELNFLPCCVFLPLSGKIFRFCCSDLLPQSWMSSGRFRCLVRGWQGAPDSPKNGLVFFVDPSVPGLLHIPWISASAEIGFPLHVLLLPTTCPRVWGWSCHQDSFKISLYNHFHHSKEKWLPVAESRFQYPSLSH